MINFKTYGYINDGNRINWRVSAAIEVDQAFWYKNGVKELIVVKGERTIGNALNFINSLDKSASKLNKNLSVIQLNTNTELSFESYFSSYLELKKVLLTFLQGKVLLYDEIYSLLSIDRIEFNITETELLTYLQVGYLLGEVNISSGVSYPVNNYICNRCGSSENIFIRDCKRCNDACAVCEECINLGRSKTCTPLYYFALENNIKTPSTPHSTLNTQLDYLVNNPLTAFQQKIANESVEFLTINQSKKHLIWAVTGAGKTEMIFPAINHAISKGYRVLFTTPRRDVVKELSPRFKKAFSDMKIVTLYGGSEEKWDEGDLYIATTHQVLRFWDYFDLIIIDEFDAYPYNNQPILQLAVKRALRATGKTIFMTATPTDEWLKLSKKELKTSILPLRYHQQPLPIPVFKLSPKSNRILTLTKPFYIISHFISEVKKKDGQAFIFVPKISDVSLWTAKLKEWFSQEIIEGVYASDKLRDTKIEAFKNGEIQFLVTTTIMERGVTIPNLDVLVLNANEKIFDKSTLIQIAGRVGRSIKYPDGIVLFLGEYKTKAIADTIKHIKWMNKKAKSF